MIVGRPVSEADVQKKPYQPVVLPIEQFSLIAP